MWLLRYILSAGVPGANSFGWVFPRGELRNPDEGADAWCTRDFLYFPLLDESVLFFSLFLSLTSYKMTPRSYCVVFFYLPVGGTLSSCGFAPSFSPPLPTAAGIVEEVCFDRIKCNFRVPSTAFSLERLSAKPISCYKLWMELMRSAGRRDFYIPEATLWALFSHTCAHLTFESYLMKSIVSVQILLSYFINKKNYNTKDYLFENVKYLIKIALF